MNKIAVLLPYYGKWPSYFHLYLESCKHNPEIDFLFFTDIEAPQNHPKNVFFNHSTIDHFNVLASKKTGKNISIKSAYKLCDFKPAYGHIFEDFLVKYNYWAIGDIDLFYGDIMSFVSAYIPHYDILSFRPMWISGGFSLFKNSRETNLLYQKSCSWDITFESVGHASFCECHKLWSRIYARENILEIDENQSFTYLVKKEESNGGLKVKFLDFLKESIASTETIEISPRKAKEIYSDKEYMLYHMVTEKKTKVFNLPRWNITPVKFYIDSTGFYLENEYFSIFKPIKKTLRHFYGVIRLGGYKFGRVLAKLNLKK